MKTVYNNSKKGFAELGVLFVIGFMVLSIAAGSYYFLKSLGNYQTSDYQTNTLRKNKENEVSQSSEIEVMQKELDDTDLGSIDSDMKILENDASSL